MTKRPQENAILMLLLQVMSSSFIHFHEVLVSLCIIISSKSGLTNYKFFYETKVLGLEYIYTYKYIHTYTYSYIHMCVFIYVCVHVIVCMYTYNFIYNLTYIP